jgi:hypothetical protein
MLFFCVLDLVVADAVQALHEHHDGRNAGARDFGSVVEGAGRKAMRYGTGLGDDALGAKRLTAEVGISILLVAARNCFPVG